MAKTSINVRPCNIGSAERHNLRSKELDYIRQELSHRNEQWSEMRIADVLEDIREKYRQHTGQSMQKKATPIREGVVVIEDGTTLRQLQDFAGGWRNVSEYTRSKSHAQGRRSRRLGRERGNMEAELPCAHDFRLDGRGNRENPEAEQAGHGGNADHTGGMPWHGKGHFFRP